MAREYRERQEELYHDALAVCDDVCELAGEVDAAFLTFNTKLAELNVRVSDVYKLMRERDEGREKPLFQAMWMLGQSLAWDLENRLHVYRNGDVVREFRCAEGYSENFRNSVKKAR
ncbi:hypothetical protein FBZ84_12658 [Azospirillum baldaniorum]|nr:hypothetical protein FBZ84_12658 [Azospirillum baldaniorum]